MPDRMEVLPEWSDPDKRDMALARIAARLRQPDPLTKPELAVVFLLSHGFTYAKAASMLHVSATTVHSHVHRMMLKLNATSSTHAVATALRFGLIS